MLSVKHGIIIIITNIDFCQAIMVVYFNLHLKKANEEMLHAHV